MTGRNAAHFLGVARRHLERVQAAWDEPTDWSDLSLYGFYCLEAAIVAGAIQSSWPAPRQHRAKAEAAERLHGERGLPDVGELLVKLNTARKAAAYGDIEVPDLNAEDVASEIEQYLEAVAGLVERIDQ